MSVPPPAPHLFPPSFINKNESVMWPDNRPYHDRAIPGPGPEFPPLKRPRTNLSDSFSNQVPNLIMPPPIPPPVYRGTSKIFFKTRICAKFKEGICPLGNNCNFAHGVEELRQPPPNWKQIVTSYGDDQAGNWDDNQRIISKLKLCRSFCNGEVCPYGERCNFLHEDPSKFREDPGRFEDRENLVISGTTSLLNNGKGSHQPDGNMIMNFGFDANPTNQNPFILKTRICNQWERTGRCAYGDKCRYAHGRAELHNFGGHNDDGMVVNADPAPSKPLYTHVADLLPSDTAEMASTLQNLTETPLFKLKKLNKINRIYGDWIDDLPVRSSANT